MPLTLLLLPQQAVKFLSMDAGTLEYMQAAGVIPTLIPLLGRVEGPDAGVRDADVWWLWFVL